MDTNADIVIVGSGVAGLFCALNLPAHLKIIVLTKDKIEKSDSYLAQGGICVQACDSDYEVFFEDTLKAGHYENDKRAVDVMIRSSREIVDDLISFGVEFTKTDEEYLYTKEGGHSRPRILFHQDITGKEIMRKLITETQKRKNIEIREFEAMVDILCDQNSCCGVISRNREGDINCYTAECVVLACGGLGGLFRFSTNYNHITGDALAIALEHQIETEHVDYIQTHPTTLYAPENERCMLISESVRGEGAVLYSVNMERFVNELLPRDIVTNAVLDQMTKDDSPYVYLSMQSLGEEEIMKHFPNIYETCLKNGYNIVKENIPVVPAQHYFMGGIKVDLNSRTSMRRLYAIGENSCNGVHGANRLASNSLLESLVFSKLAAKDIEKSLNTYKSQVCHFGRPETAKYANPEALSEYYQNLIFEKIRSDSHE